jgi:hypothetical protein
MIDVVILGDADCPNLELARTRVGLALAQLGLPQTWRELDRSAAPDAWRGFASPTVLVADHDVAPGDTGCAACRLYDDGCGGFEGAPSVELIVVALQRAEGQPCCDDR